MQIVTAADRPDLDTEAAAAFREKWPEFIFHDDVAAQYAPRVETLLLALQHLRPRRRRRSGRRRVGRAAGAGTAPSRTFPTGTTAHWSARSTGTRRVARARR